MSSKVGTFSFFRKWDWYELENLWFLKIIKVESVQLWNFWRWVKLMIRSIHCCILFLDDLNDNVCFVFTSQIEMRPQIWLLHTFSASETILPGQAQTRLQGTQLKNGRLSSLYQPTRPSIQKSLHFLNHRFVSTNNIHRCSAHRQLRMFSQAKMLNLDSLTKYALPFWRHEVHQNCWIYGTTIR